MLKRANAVGSGTPDPVKAQAASAPSAPLAIGNTPAPGLKGPGGLGPRQSYSRVNTGDTPTPDVGLQGKQTPPRGLESLPKTAGLQELQMQNQISRRPAVHDLLKEAMQGTLENVSAMVTSMRQQGIEPVSTKTASAPSVTSSDAIEKVASALEYLAKRAEESTAAGTPGPNALPRLTPQDGKPVLAPNGSGAVRHQTDKTTGGLQQPQGSSATQLANNASTMHGEQPVKPVPAETSSNATLKNASALEGRNLEVVAKLAAAGKEAALLDRNLAVLGKLAEDAINPAKISAGAATRQGAQAPEGVSASGEGPVPSVPSDAAGGMRLIDSIESAINYTRADAKRDPKKDVSALLAEPALSSSTDTVLNQVFTHTGEAGAKVAEQLITTQAAHALLLKLAAAATAECAAAKKTKTSGMGQDLTTPQGQSGFSAAQQS